jgi:hypothetical protein
VRANITADGSRPQPASARSFGNGADVIARAASQLQNAGIGLDTAMTDQSVQQLRMDSSPTRVTQCHCLIVGQIGHFDRSSLHFEVASAWNDSILKGFIIQFS